MERSFMGYRERKELDGQWGIIDDQYWRYVTIRTDWIV